MSILNHEGGFMLEISHDISVVVLIFLLMLHWIDEYLIELFVQLCEAQLAAKARALKRC